MTKAMVVIGFLVAFAAGLTVGLELRRTSVASAPSNLAGPTTSSSRPSTRSSRSPGWFASQLKLTPQQQKDMDQIWSEVARGGRGEMEKRRQELRDERDAAIAALVGTDNKARYDEIQQHYRDQQYAMERDMRKRFESAVERTKVLLTDEQRSKYDEMLARHRPPDRAGDRGGDRDGRSRGGPEKQDSDHRGGGDDGATSKPLSQPL